MIGGRRAETEILQPSSELFNAETNTGTAAVSQAPNGRMTTLLMNALILCVFVCAGGGVYGFMTVFGVAVKQTPLSFKHRRTNEETHILNTCWLLPPPAVLLSGSFPQRQMQCE